MPNPTQTQTHRERLAQMAREVNEQAGIFGPPTMTAEELQAAQAARGLRPEDNVLSRELLRMRYGADYNPDTDE